mgnify:CR=1 FL=1
MNNIDSEIYTDISIIISMMPVEMKNKINNDFINFIENNKSENYISNINPKIPIKKQNIRKETKEMMGIIYRDYLCSNEERKKLIIKGKQELDEYDKKIKKNYNADNLFKDKKSVTNMEEGNKSFLPTVIQKKSIFTKVLNCIKKIFKRN